MQQEPSAAYRCIAANYMFTSFYCSVCIVLIHIYMPHDSPRARLPNGSR